VRAKMKTKMTSKGVVCWKMNPRSVTQRYSGILVGHMSIAAQRETRGGFDGEMQAVYVNSYG
jgi:hypothetical protein